MAEELLSTNWRGFKHSREVRKFAESIELQLKSSPSSNLSASSISKDEDTSDPYILLTSLLDQVNQHFLVLQLNESLTSSISSLKEFERSIDTYCDTSSEKLIHTLEKSVGCFQEVQRFIIFHIYLFLCSIKNYDSGLMHY